MNIPIFIALDGDDPVKAMELAKSVKEYVGGYKVGHRITMRCGQEWVKELGQLGEVFIDHKFYDITNTMLASVRTAFDLGATYTTIHASIGCEALKELALLEKELNKKRFFKILAVTVLTSFEEGKCPSLWKLQRIEEHVSELVDEVVEAGLSGIVCSALEVEKLKERYPSVFFVTPGIRFMNERNWDQKRIMGPRDALKAGASALVVGRPICEADDPVLTAKSYYLATQKER